MLKWIPLAVFGAGVLGLASPSPAEMITLPVVEDTFLDGLTSSNIEGAGPNLAICPVVNYWIYLKFDLRDIRGPITNATLRMSRTSGSRPNEIVAYLITDDSWSQDTLTGPLRPAPQSPTNDTSLAAGAFAGVADVWSSAALTAAIQSEVNGDGIVTIMLREDPGPIIDVRRYVSSEGSATVGEPGPDLVIETAPAAGNWMILF